MLHVEYIKFNIVQDPIKLTPVLKILLKYVKINNKILLYLTETNNFIIVFQFWTLLTKIWGTL